MNNYTLFTPQQLDKEAWKTMDNMVDYRNSMTRKGMIPKDIIESTTWKELKERMDSIRSALPKDAQQKYSNPLIEEILQYIT